MGKKIWLTNEDIQRYIETRDLDEDMQQKVLWESQMLKKLGIWKLIEAELQLQINDLEEQLLSPIANWDRNEVRYNDYDMMRRERVLYKDLKEYPTNSIKMIVESINNKIDWEETPLAT